MAVKLLVSVRSPSKSWRCACPSLYWYKRNRTTFEHTNVIITLNSNRHGYQVISLCKYTHQNLQYACPSLYGSKLNRTSFDKPIVPIMLWTLKDMAIKLSVSIRSPIKTLRYACPSLYSSKLNRSTLPSYRTYITLKTNRHGYQVISLCKITHQIFRICISISILI